MKQEIRFYFCIILGAILIFFGFYTPPTGVIDNSVIAAFGMLLIIGGLSVGIDIKGIIREIRLLKEEKKNENNV